MINQAAQFSDMPLTQHEFGGGWHSDGILRNIAMAEGQVEAAGLSIEALKDLSAGPLDPEEPRSRRRKRMTKSFQKTVTRELGRGVLVNAVARMRFKLERWV